jgi:hypothetical protein
MAQLYVGKRAISEGIGAAIRKFVVLGFRGPLYRDHSGERLHDSMNDSGVAPRPRRMMRNRFPNLSHAAFPGSAICMEITGQSDSWEMRKVRKDGSVLWAEEADGSRPA